ncbi:MAG: flagellar motor switch protein FliM [Chloroflexota bacterium]
MTEILSQKEIDQLIAAISSGEAKVEGARTAERPRQLRVYDFRRPSKFSKEQIRTLQMLHDNFSRLLTTYFSTLFRTMIQLGVASVDELTYGEFMRSMPSPGVIAVLDLEPLKGSGILEISPSIAFPMIDRLFGGSGQPLDKPRALSEIEQTVMERVINGFLANLREAWKNIIELKPQLDAIETNPLFSQIVAPNEIVVTIVFRAKIGDYAGAMNLCIPYIVIEPILSRLTAHNWFAASQRETTPEVREAVSRKVGATEMAMVVELGATEVTLGEMLELKVGDVIRLDNRIDEELNVRVGPKIKYRARPGKVGKHLAVQLSSVVTEGVDGEDE